MAYLGTPIDTTNQFQSLSSKQFNGDGGTTDFTLDIAPGSVNDIEVFVGNVRQDPHSAYTLSGTTLSFTGAPPSGTNNIYVVHQAKSVGTIDVPASGVQAGSLASSVLTGQTDIGADIADADLFLIDDGAGGTLRKTAASRIKTYAGFGVSSITGATEDTTVPITTDEHIMNVGGALRRVDHNIVTAVNTPWFQARGLTSNQSIPNDTNTVITNWNNITINSKQDSGTSSQSMSSNGRFTFGVAGYYQINTSLTLDSVSSGKNIRIMIYSPHDDVTYIVAGQMTAASTATYRLAGSLVLPAGSSRYFEMQVYHNHGSTITVSQGSFSVFRIASYDLP